MYCVKCGNKNRSEALFCEKCGEAINNVTKVPPASGERKASLDNDAKNYYDAVIGEKNTNYYLSLFEKFDLTGSKISWNWPVFFLTVYWFLYRKMWGWAAIYFVLHCAIALVGSGLGGAPAFDFLSGVISLLIFPMYANYLYHRVVKKKIERVSRTATSEQDIISELIALGGTSRIVLILIPIFAIFMIGVLAAIALPAYQDYIVRSKMSEPMVAMAEAKTTIAEYVARNGQYPKNTYEFGVNTDLRSAHSEVLEQIVVSTVGDKVYVTALVDACTWDGTACLTSKATNTAAFSIYGYTNDHGTMSWQCVPGDAQGLSAIEKKYLPANCRG